MIPIIILCCASIALSEDSVKFAAVIYRHGDRTPVDPYPTDPWRNESLWPVKFGELTNTGKMQHYVLGEWLRQRYSHLLSKEFNPSEIYVRSTDVDRTLMSAQANLAGMYPPYGSSIWNTQLLWQPIPVHSVPERDDEILAMKKSCLAYDKEFETFIHSKTYKDRLSKYQSLMNYLSAHTGMKIQNYNDIGDIYSTLYIESLYNFTLPNWTHSVYPDKMWEPAGFSFRILTATPLLARLKVGPLFTQIITHMMRVISNEHSKFHKVSIYSGHDITIGNMLNALDLYNGLCPTYTSTVIFELLYDNITTEHYVRISYRNSSQILEPNILYIPYCGKKCSISRFKKLYDNLLIADWEYECDEQFPPLLGVSFVIGLCLFITIYISHKIHFARVYKKYRDNLAYNGINNQVDTPIKLINA